MPDTTSTFVRASKSGHTNRLLDRRGHSPAPPRPPDQRSGTVLLAQSRFDVFALFINFVFGPGLRRWLPDEPLLCDWSSEISWCELGMREVDPFAA